MSVHHGDGFVIILLPSPHTDIGHAATLLENNGAGIGIFGVAFAQIIKKAALCQAFGHREYGLRPE